MLWSNTCNLYEYEKGSVLLKFQHQDLLVKGECKVMFIPIYPLMEKTSKRRRPHRCIFDFFLIFLIFWFFWFFNFFFVSKQIEIGACSNRYSSVYERCGYQIGSTALSIDPVASNCLSFWDMNTFLVWRFESLLRLFRPTPGKDSN